MKPFRRLNRHERKEKIEQKGELFPLNDDTPSPAPPQSEQGARVPLLDLSDLPNDDPQALAELASFPSGLIARPLKIAPPEERYPPLEPVVVPETPTLTTPLPIVQAEKVNRENTLGYHLITAFFLVLTTVTCGIYALIWSNPHTPINPLPPPTTFIIITATPIEFIAPVVAPTQESTQIAKFPFQLANEPLYVANANGRGCEWASLAGNVLDKDGNALNGYRVRVIGEAMNQTVFSGATLAWGAGGYELPLGNAPVAKSFTVQLFSPQDAPLSDPIAIETRATCEQNVVLINFVAR